ALRGLFRFAAPSQDAAVERAAAAVRGKAPTCLLLFPLKGDPEKGTGGWAGYSCPRLPTGAAFPLPKGRLAGSNREPRIPARPLDGRGKETRQLSDGPQGGNGPAALLSGNNSTPGSLRFYGRLTPSGGWPGKNSAEIRPAAWQKRTPG